MTKKKETDDKKALQTRSRTFAVILYPAEDIKHKFLLDWYTKHERVVWITHDKDKWQAEDEKLNSDHKAGTNKKPHVHMLIRYEQPKTLGSITKKFTDFYNLNNTQPINNFHVEKVSDINDYIRYMIHSTIEAQYQLKYQYKQSDLHGDKQLIESALSCGRDNRSDLNKMFAYIISQDLDFCQLAQYVVSDLAPPTWKECFFANQYLFRNFCYDRLNF